MISLIDQTVGSIVAQNYKAAEVFDKYSIDFCCQGRTTLDEACRKKNVDVSQLRAELEMALKEPGNQTIDFASWAPDLLCDYIEKNHHRYVLEAIPALDQYLEKVTRVHGERHPELSEVYRLFSEAAQELLHHMKKEELILFPAIRKMVVNRLSGNAFSPPPFGSIQNPIQMMEQEHEFAGSHFQRIAELTGQYNPPADGCTTYRVSFAKLQEFEQDLHRHVHLENNILFPKAIEMERELAIG
ncbi:MAG: iron-sulfur cluster repair di-iron protein [Saprospirales bacterium]|nr:iron-sulfur cluster repair di-iron protein [Saprospirales bacterium]